MTSRSLFDWQSEALLQTDPISFVLVWMENGTLIGTMPKETIVHRHDNVKQKPERCIRMVINSCFCCLFSFYHSVNNIFVKYAYAPNKSALLFDIIRQLWQSACAYWKYNMLSWSNLHAMAYNINPRRMQLKKKNYLDVIYIIRNEMYWQDSNSKITIQTVRLTREWKTKKQHTIESKQKRIKVRIGWRRKERSRDEEEKMKQQNCHFPWFQPNCIYCHFGA